MRHSWFSSGAAAGLILAAASASALAHAYPKSADPPMNGTVGRAPDAVVIDFTSPLEPALSSIEVRNAAGARVDKGDAHTDKGDAKRLRVGLKALSPGTYRVLWHATSVDTHRTEGSFTFTITH